MWAKAKWVVKKHGIVKKHWKWSQKNWIQASYFLLIVDLELFPLPSWASFCYEWGMRIIIYSPQGCYKDLLVGESEVLLFFCRLEKEIPKLRTLLDWVVGSWRTSAYIPSCHGCSHPSYSPTSALGISTMDDASWFSAEWFLIWRWYKSLWMVYISF